MLLWIIHSTWRLAYEHYNVHFLNCQHFNEWMFSTFSFWRAIRYPIFLFKMDTVCDRQPAKYDLYVILGDQRYLTQVSHSTELCQCPQSH